MIAKGNGTGAKNPAAVALGSMTSAKKKISSLKNGMGNKSKTGQKLSEETKALLRQRWVERKARAAEKKAAAIDAAAEAGNGETESA